jgi:hypothetical protein
MHNAVVERSGACCFRDHAHHIYFTYDETADVLEVRAVWHAQRGRGPAL